MKKISLLIRLNWFGFRLVMEYIPIDEMVQWIVGLELELLVLDIDY